MRGYQTWLYKGQKAVRRQPELLWQSSPGVPSGVMDCLRVLADCRRSCARFPPSLSYTAMSVFCAEWLCTQARWNPEVAIIFGAAALNRRAAVGSCRDDAHPDNPTLHTGAVRPHTGFEGGIFFISPRTGHGSSQVFGMLSAFRIFREQALFVCPSRQKRETRILPRWAGVGSSGISWRILSLVKKTQHR
jgi:hypothetical protein